VDGELWGSLELHESWAAHCVDFDPRCIKYHQAKVTVHTIPEIHPGQEVIQQPPDCLTQEVQICDLLQPPEVTFCGGEIAGSKPQPRIVPATAFDCELYKPRSFKSRQCLGRTTTPFYLSRLSLSLPAQTVPDVACTPVFTRKQLSSGRKNLVCTSSPLIMFAVTCSLKVWPVSHCVLRHEATLQTRALRVEEHWEDKAALYDVGE
jgi:hypothetical protein